MRICVLGETLEQAIQLLDLLCEANEDDIYRRRRDVGIMNDGTELVPMSISDVTKFWGREFDYVFYEDGMMGKYCACYGPAIEYIEQRSLVRSTIPREFQWSKVNTR